MNSTAFSGVGQEELGRRLRAAGADNCDARPVGRMGPGQIDVMKRMMAMAGIESAKACRG